MDDRYDKNYNNKEKWWLLKMSLEAAVSLEQHRLANQGGPSDEDIEKLAGYGLELAEKGDQLLYRSKETAKIFTHVAEAIAVLSFFPGGVTIFDTTYDGKKLLERAKRRVSNSL